jgi:diadenylate cyclase
MLSSFYTYLGERSLGGLLRDALDISIVYYACYRGLLVLRGTRAMQVGAGLLMLLALFAAARLLELATVTSILGTLFSSLLLIIVVVFQNDIRRGLQRIGSQAFLARLGRNYGSKVLDEVIEASTELARHRIGALIAFEQEANLDEFVGTHKGHIVDAAVTRELLVSLFVPEAINKLHDGAVIIRNLRVAKAGVFFPMPEQRVVDSSFGSRHRAALGITEETDAVVVVVSEERGNISFCFNGNIASNLDGPKLRTMLEAVFSPKSVRKRAAKIRRSASATPLPVPGPESRREIEEPVPIAARAEATPLNFARVRPGVDTEGAPSVRPRPLVDTGEDTLRARIPRESDPPPRIRKGGESEHPTPLRTRPGIDDFSPRIPKAAKVPVLLPRVVMPVRAGDALTTPTADAAMPPATTADGRGGDAKEAQAIDSNTSRNNELDASVPGRGDKT